MSKGCLVSGMDSLPPLKAVLTSLVSELGSAGGGGGGGQGRLALRLKTSCTPYQVFYAWCVWCIIVLR